MRSARSSLTRAYMAHRRRDGIAPATIRRELAILKRMFTLAVHAGRLPQAPHIPTIQVENTREGFFESADFGLNPDTIHEYGTVDVSLINDLPLFIDPFLLFTSGDEELRALHDHIIEYLRFLRGRAEAGSITRGLLQEWYCFPEVKQLWLGYSLVGNEGSGLGMDFARKLHENLHTVFSSFGAEEITRGSHLEKLCLIESGVGRDNVSDFMANLIKRYLAEYTARFAAEHVDPSLIETHFVPKNRFDYETETWVADPYALPTHAGDFVLLAPRTILTKDDTWIIVQI